MVTLRSFIADTLRAASPAAEWVSGGVDRADELAGILIENGLTDLTKIGITTVEVDAKQSGLEYGEIIGEKTCTDARTPFQIMQGAQPREFCTGRIRAFVFTYEGRQIGYLGEPGKKFVNEPYLTSANTFHGLEFAWSPAGHGHVGYSVTFDKRGFALAPRWGSSSDWSEFRNAVKTAIWFYGTAYMMVAGSAFASNLGSSIIGASNAAAYPALAQVVGNVAMSTALNGGNVESAVKGAALAYVGAQVGAGVAEVTDIDLLGKVAASATTAALRGGDVESAIALTLARNAGDTLTVFETDKGPVMEDFSNYGDAGADGDPYVMDVPNVQTVEPWSPSDVMFSGPAIGAGSSLTGEVFFDTQPAELTFADLSTYTLAAPAQMQIQIEAPQPTPDPDPWTLANARNVVNSISQMALTALGVTRAFQAASNPQINPNARNVAQNGTVTTALDTGVVQTRTPDGRSVNQRPPVGVAQSTINGNVIVNNGDGTYTLIDASGNRRIIKYGSNAGSGLSDLPWPLIIGGAGALIALLK